MSSVYIYESAENIILTVFADTEHFSLQKYKPKFFFTWQIDLSTDLHFLFLLLIVIKHQDQAKFFVEFNVVVSKIQWLVK